MQTAVSFQFFGECNIFLAPERRCRRFLYIVKGRPAVKDTIEALGVPHTEVAAIFVNRVPSGFGRQLKEGDQIAVHPRWGKGLRRGFRRLHKALPTRPKFICDVHLGKLAKHLRLLGFDTFYENDLTDEDIVRRSVSERRVVLTRDVGLLKNKRIVWGYFVRSTDPEEQISEVVSRIAFAGKILAFRRCLQCNDRLHRIKKSQIAHRLPPRVRDAFHEFYNCKSCDKIFWQGSHHQRLSSVVSKFSKRHRQ